MKSKLNRYADRIAESLKLRMFFKLGLIIRVPGHGNLGNYQARVEPGRIAQAKLKEMLNRSPRPVPARTS